MSELQQYYPVSVFNKSRCFSRMLIGKLIFFALSASLHAQQSNGYIGITLVKFELHVLQHIHLIVRFEFFSRIRFSEVSDTI